MNLESAATGKRSLNAEKNVNVIDGVCHLIRTFHLNRTSPCVFEDSNRIIKFWSCADDDKLFSPYKTQRNYNLRKMTKLLFLSTKLWITAEVDIGLLQHQRALHLRCCGGSGPRSVSVLCSIKVWYFFYFCESCGNHLIYLPKTVDYY